MALLTEQQCQQYQDDGYLLLPGVLKEQVISPVRLAIAEAVERDIRQLWEQGKIKSLHEDASFERRLAEIGKETAYEAKIWNREVFGKAIYDLLTTPALLDVAESLLGPEVAVNGDYWVRTKLPQSEVLTYPWHQDSGYYGEQTVAAHILSVWIPLVDVDEHNGCMQVIPGSHRWGLLSVDRDEFGHHIPTENLESRGDVVSLPMKTGDVFLFHNLTFHRSLMNRSDIVRWSIDLRYSPMGTDVAWLDAMKLYGFTARSSADPHSVETWEQWQAKWKEPQKSLMASAP